MGIIKKKIPESKTLENNHKSNLNKMMRTTLLASLVFASALAEQRFLADDNDFELLCNPDDPEQCVRLPGQGGLTGGSDGETPMVGQTAGSDDFELLCNPDDPDQCVRLPGQGDVQGDNIRG